MVTFLAIEGFIIYIWHINIKIQRVLYFSSLIMYTIFWLESLKERDRSEDLVVDGRMILERILGKDGGEVRTGFIWLRIGTSGGLL
jgi:hypothetical protein